MKKREQEPQTLTGPQVLEKLKTGREKGLTRRRYSSGRPCGAKTNWKGQERKGFCGGFFASLPIL